MDSWLTHSLTAAGSLLVGFLPFLLKWKQATSSEWQTIVIKQGERITALESRVEELHAEHTACLQIQSDLRAQIAALQAARPAAS
jgi:hypothetical protein